ncbi:SmpA/OmlA domain-containing protein [Ahrensia sp. R2A130]|nr:outer membrane protein assembly factor BamE [Ahrensia sp. R2A130]EFL90522.1 SmpA/OmlA domain-containing protein [Ahrensia sp. R2A130]
MKRSKTASATLVLATLTVSLALTACNPSRQVYTHGYQVNDQALALVPEGSSREQVLLTLGTPSTTQTEPDGTETFYYISQRKERPVAFLAAQVVDQRVLAVNMDQNDQVEQIANYGLKDGKVFDFIGRVTPTGGKELSFVGQLLNAAGSINPGNVLGR